MFKRITPGGRITIVLALVWSAAVFQFISSHDPYSELIVWVLGSPVDEPLTRRGPPPGLAEVMKLHAVMVPYLFLLGYGIAGVLRFVRWRSITLRNDGPPPAPRPNTKG